jgi:glycosyltransferase involved in cell wall biosynthesis
MDKTVSVIIPTYNCGEYIVEAIDSILNQTYKNYEIIVVDDGSTDETKKRLEKYNNKEITYIYQENKGISVARNRGIKASTGELIAFLDADDMWLPEKLERQINIFKNFPQTGLLGCGYYRIDKTGERIEESSAGNYADKESLLNDLMVRNVIAGSGSGVLIKKECLDRVGLFDESFRSIEDRDMWFRIVKIYESRFVNEHLVIIRTRNHSLSKNVKMMKCNQKKFIQKHLKRESLARKNKSYSYVYLDAAREYYGAHKKLLAATHAFIAFIIYPFKVYPDDDKYQIFIKSFLPNWSLLILRKIRLKLKEVKNVGIWLFSYLWQSLLRKEKTDALNPIHIIFCIVDHFEPFNGKVSLEKAKFRVQAWLDEYPKLASKFIDSDGKMPQHTWFYAAHHDQRFLDDLVKLCRSGYGEIEMHLHHNHINPFPDTEETLRTKIMQCIENYSRYGIFCLPDGSRRFAFIHGDWSLDNSRGKEICGVNNEISILKECGCYADFTFPSLGEAQPAKINKIYYAKDEPQKPKSYNWGKDLEANGESWGDLLMIPGIVGLRWKPNHRFKLSIEASNLDQFDYPSQERIDYWVKNALTIKGKPNWIFIKLHTHGSREKNWDSLFGEKAEQMFRYLETKYKENSRYLLHYVTAREMYNIAKAAEAGKEGNPGEYRNFLIPKYVYSA